MIIETISWYLILTIGFIFMMYSLYFHVVMRQVAYLACKYDLVNVSEDKIERLAKSRWLQYAVKLGLSERQKRPCRNFTGYIMLLLIIVIFGFGSMSFIISIVIHNNQSAFSDATAYFTVICAMIWGLWRLRKLSQDLIALA